MIELNVKNFIYGGDYNPEQWGEEVWKEDVRLMKVAGVNLVSVAIFSWALIQPDEKTFNFDWLDRIVNLLYKNGIYVCLATSTAAQPAWASIKYPDIFPVDEKGVKFSHGSRQTYCPNSPNYKRLSKNLAEKMSEHFKNNPALKMWHVNNEYGCHVVSCYCENCEKAFRQWLKNKYKTIEKVNDAWGTNFWGQRYYQWEEIIPPRLSTTINNPGQVLDYRRFFCDSTLELYKDEYNILKKNTPNIPVTTNFIPVNGRKYLDHFKWAKHIDIIAVDLYPDPSLTMIENAKLISFTHNFMRGLKDGQPFILMEQAPSQVNWMNINTNKRPGVMRLWSYEAISHGADGVMFFQWRQAIKGAEKYHSAMVTHTGNENSRVFNEVSKLGNELKFLDEIMNSKINSEAALLFDFDNWWAVEYESLPSKEVGYLDQIMNYHNALFNLHISTDIVSVESDFSKYSIVIAPLLYMIKSGVLEKFNKFVSNGGTLIITFFSGIVNENDAVFKGGYPGPLKELLGIEVEEFSPMAKGEKNSIKLTKKIKGLKNKYTCDLWGEVIHKKTARDIAVFTDDYYSNMSVVTENIYGKGKVYYIGTQPEEAFYENFLRSVLKEKNISPVYNTPRNVQAAKRIKDGKVYIFLLNHGDEKETIKLDKKYFNMIDRKYYVGKITLLPKDVAVLN